MNKFKNVEKFLKLNFKQKSRELSSIIQYNNLNLFRNKNNLISIYPSNRPINAQFYLNSAKNYSTNNQNKNPEASSTQNNSNEANTLNYNKSVEGKNSENNQSAKSNSTSVSISSEIPNIKVNSEINENINTSKINNNNNDKENNINHNDSDSQKNDTSKESTNLTVQPKTGESSNLAPIDRETLKQTTMKKLNEHIPLEKISDEVLREMIQYRVFEDSVAETVQRVSKDVPEIAEHDKFRTFIQEAIENDLQDELKNKEGLIILKKKSDPLIKYGMDYHHYRNYADRDYQVDIREVLEKDLFEKQRVIDSYVEENKEKINEILGYYENRIKYTKHNKFSYLIYQNNYLGKKMNKIRINFLKQICTTGILSAAAALANPLLCVLLMPEYFSILYTMFVLNRTIDQIILTENKQSLRIRNFNFLGLRREIPGATYEISRIRYVSKFQNNVLNLSDRGFTFATRLLWRVLKPITKFSSDSENTVNKNKSEEEMNKANEKQKSEGSKKKNIYNSSNANSKNNEESASNNESKNKNTENNFGDLNKNESKRSKKILDNFQSFHMILANGDVFYLPADLSQQHADTNEQLLLDILNNNYKNVLEFDYSEYEDRSTQFYEMVENWKKEYAKKSHEEYLTKEEKLQSEYSKYIGNRDYSEKNTAVTLKRADGLDGTFIDNGYR